MPSQTLIDAVACVIHRELPHEGQPLPDPNCYACRLEAEDFIDALRAHGVKIELGEETHAGHTHPAPGSAGPREAAQSRP